MRGEIQMFVHIQIHHYKFGASSSCAVLSTLVNFFVVVVVVVVGIVIINIALVSAHCTQSLSWT